MDNNLKDEISEKVLSWLQSGEEFAIEQAPQLCSEIIAWEIVSSILGIAIGIVVLAVAIRWMYIGYSRDEEDPISEGIFVIGLGLFTVGSAPFLVNLFFLLRVLISPRLVIVQYLGF